jgi:ADP-ribose pyrophosphatase
MVDLTPSYGHDDIEILSRDKVFQGFVDLESISFRQRLFSGEWSDPMQRECLSRPPVAGVLPYDPIADVVVLLEQCRVGAMGGEASPWLLEIVAGLQDKPGESLEDLARREAQEEAGLDILALAPMHTYWASPGGSAERVSLFCGKVVAPASGGVYGVPSEHEDIRTLILPFDQAMLALERGRICNAMTVIALQWLKLHKNELEQGW